MSSYGNRFQERWQTYKLGPNSDARLATVAPGANFTTSITLDSDAPFVLRGTSVRSRYQLVSQVIAIAPVFVGQCLNGLAYRFTGYDQNYLQDQLVPANINQAFFGQGGCPKPIHPEETYPPSTTIYVDVQNFGNTTFTNLSFYFHGVKLFPWGSNLLYSYPERMSILPYAIPHTITALGVSEYRFNQIIRAPLDGDFVLRSIQAGFFYPNNNEVPGYPGAYEVFVMLKDEQLKPYMNDWCHIDMLFGRTLLMLPFGQTEPLYLIGATDIPAFPPAPPSITWEGGPGASNPGLVYPELYIPKNHLLYMDIRRDDAFVAGFNSGPPPTILVPQDIPFAFNGSKVFPK